MTEKTQETEVTLAPQAHGDWYIVEPANPVDDKGSPIIIPESAKDKWLRYGIVMSDPTFHKPKWSDSTSAYGEDSPVTIDHNLVAIHFDRSSAHENIPALDHHGVPVGPKYIAVHKSTIQAMWRIPANERQRFLNPPATANDPELLKQRKNRVELQ